MTTTKVSEDQAQEIPTPSKPESATASFGFFHRHQKLIIYTAGLFTLLTFSITGAVMSVSDRWSRKVELPRITVPGQPGEIEVTEEDDAVGRLIRTLKNFQDQGYAVRAEMGVVPFIATPENSDDPLRFAALRRLALATGVDASADDADLAIQGAIGRTGSQSVADLARLHGIQDPSRFASIVREALRITTFLRLTVLGVGGGDADAVSAILKDNDEIGFQVADLDLDAIKKRLEKVQVTDAELDKFLKALEEQEQSKYRHPTNKAAFELAFVSTADFDPASHKDELEGYKPSDAEIRNHYDRYKEDYFKVVPPKKNNEKKTDKDGNEEEDNKNKGDENKNADAKNPKAKDAETKAPDAKDDKNKTGKPEEQDDNQTPASKPLTTDPKTDPKTDQEQQPTHRPFDEVKEAIVKKLQVNHVLRAWRKQLDAKVAAHMQPAFDARYAVTEALTKAEKEQAEAQKKAGESKDDKELAAALEAAKKAVETQKKAYEAADEVVKQRLESFDFKAAVESLAKVAVVFASVDEPKFAEDLKELPADLGTWNGSFAATSVAKSGEIHSSVQDVEKGAFLLRVTDLKERPFKEFAEIKDDLRVHFYTDKADKEGEEKKEKFEKALERLSREKGKDAIAEIEKKQTEQLKEKVDKWRADLQQKVDDYTSRLAQSQEGDWRHKKLKEKRDALQVKLNGEKEFSKKTKEALEKTTKDEIKDVEKKHYQEVLAAAAKEGGFELVEVGPYSKKLDQTPRFENGRSKLVQFLFSKPELMDMEEGKATDILEDKTERRICLAVCTKVGKAKSTSITRRQWMEKQEGMTIFAMRQRMIDNPQLMWPLLRAFQQNPQLQPLQQLFYEVIGGKSKDKARELMNHPLFLPMLRQMVEASAPFAGGQKQRAANQSFTMEALKQGYGWHDPSAAKREANPTEKDAGGPPTSMPADPKDLKKKGPEDPPK